MPKVTVYVSDELKARMDGFKGAEWSAAAQKSFEKEIHIMESQMTASTIEDAVTRLRASKQLTMDTDVEQGKDCGTQWALKRATYGELKAVAAIDLDLDYEDDHLAGVVGRAIDYDYGPNEFWQHETDDQKPSNEFVIAFVEAAVAVLDQVDAKI